MKSQSVLVTLALLSATLHVSVDAKQASAGEMFTELAQPMSKKDADLVARRGVLGALAYVPVETDGFIAFADMGKHIGRAISGGMLLDQPVGPVPPEILALKSVAVSMGAGGADGLRLLLPVLASATQREDGVKGWVDEADTATAQKMKEAIQQLVEEQKRNAVEDFRNNWQLKPIYAVVSLDEKQQKQVEQWANMIVSMLLVSYADQAETLEYGAFRGVKIKNAPVTQGAGRDICIMVKSVDSSLVVVLCGNPQEIREPGTIEQSALASCALSACDACLDDLFFVSHSSRDMVRVMEEWNRSSISHTADMARRIFEVLGAADAAQKVAFDKAAVGVNVLMEQVLSACGAQQNQDNTLLCRINKKNLVLEYSGDAMGAAYEPGVLRYAAQAKTADNILYAESTPFSSKTPAPNWEKILSALLDVGRGYSLTLPAESRADDEKLWRTLEALQPEFNMLGQAFSTVGSGLGRGGAVLIDSAAGLPSFFGGSRNNQIAMPRLAYCLPVTQRDCLSRGWNEILTAAEGVAEKLFGSRLLIKALAFPSKKVGVAESYSLYMPICTENMIPNVTVSDSAFVAGTSSAYNEKLANEATGTTKYQGAVFALHFENLASTLRGIADSYRSRIPAEEEAVPMAFSDDVTPVSEEKSTAELTTLEKVSETLEELAVAAELTADLAESMYGSITISADRCTLRTVVNLQQK